ncbi:hypothetical protein [Nocardia africana]|uniref:Uncharacterized protein n=1 Tax=Nocardia africana TaxID=134964 RepID=A0A378WQF8_9NOCA|nr:hypothetical protein [Nocardia africana]MCC3315023.1 hypothetical protein [Nocardia africana]SUA42691.1 Uncharacterised protein [Nocardia africana]
MFWEFVLLISIPLAVILLAVFWPEQISKSESRDSVRAIIDRIARENRSGEAKYRDRYRE